MEMKEHEDRAAQAVADQAAEWFIRLKDRDLSMFERRKFVRWLKQSPGNIAEFMRLVQLYGRVKRAKVPLLPPQEEQSTNVIEWASRESMPLPEPRAGFFDSRNARFAAVACGFALVAVIGVIVNFVLASNTIETHMSEWRKVHLADGTQVNAGPNTLLNVDFSDGVRRVYLQRGEAMFSVTHDASRPFIVNAGTAAVRAVGTRFGVDRREDGVRITVAEGRVAVVRGDQAATLEKALNMNVVIAMMTQDERVEIPVNAPSMRPQVEKVNSTNALAWANGQLVFQNATLGEAVREFNRRNQIQIEVDDPTVAAWHVCCVFDAADPEAFAKLIAADDSIALVRQGPTTLRLVPQAPGQAEPPSQDDAI